ncbi:RRD1 [Candida pseudojiufengensis]|uniref:RRD1 n=1 Tax=Candida pseudojiufengensis TaxID=497109 RepID=UPI0022259871|nr:RRD1 [Candida pseudojiufengensis]KAI5963456.1 RRD1 [Candida pseudojiufengensis]
MNEKAVEPIKKIYDVSDLKNFEKSIAYKGIQQTLNQILLLVQDVKVPPGVLSKSIVTRESNQSSNISTLPATAFEQKDEFKCQGNIQLILDIFDKSTILINETEPIKGPTRFGNIAYRVWYEKMDQILPELLDQLHYKHHDKAQFMTELKYYLINSFGSKMRLDYGTGHELSYLAFIGALIQNENVLSKPTGEEILVLFAKYYDLIRNLILTYNLEPAGSHGVWGLDDHFHLIYILGASQFCDDKFAPSVRQVLSSQVINAYKLSNLYVNAIAFIFKLKTGPFNEHSPIINDIHMTVISWSKVRQGLSKMYMVEVLGKYPVIQHFWFGEKLYPWKDHDGKTLPVFQPEESKKSTKKNPTSNQNIPMTAAPWANR